MSAGRAPVTLVLLWHHHQPDYRSPRESASLLPWVRLHATKDYLDMALHLERHPSVHAAFNFVPSLLDQLEDAAAGRSDRLFDLLARPVETLAPAERGTLGARCGSVPRWARERWPRCRAVLDRAAIRGAELADGELLSLEVWFLLAWLDPLLHGEPEAARALAHSGTFTVRHRDDLLDLHHRLLSRVVPAYRALAERGQVELSASAYYHPILPLLVDLSSARRARPELPLPSEPLAAGADAEAQLRRAFERHRAAFGTAPAGSWPPEGSVSPEVAELAARLSVRWLATDEGVLWSSLPVEARRREALYRPWRIETAAGEVSLLFRDRELSDRIGFVYHHWEPGEAAADFLERLRKIGRDRPGPEPALVTVILDGENCWEHYPEDGGPFLEALYRALESSPDVLTRTPSEALAEAPAAARLDRLHSGSWIDADFHIWIGHPEKNLAWDLVSRTRRALVEAERLAPRVDAAWESLYTAEGSDWFWWFGEDHFTADKEIFDRLFREHLQAAHVSAGLAVPSALAVAVARASGPGARARQPLGFVRPVVDGERTQFYEWHEAGQFQVGAGGGAMHHDSGRVQALYFGFDLERFYLRLDFPHELPGVSTDLVLEWTAPRAIRVAVQGLTTGVRPVAWRGGARDGQPVPGARAVLGSILELAIPFAALGLTPGDSVELLAQLAGPDGRPTETLPADDLVRFAVPDETYPEHMWSA